MKQPCLRREYHTWKIPEIKSDMKYNDFVASNTRAIQREQSAYGLSRFDELIRSGSWGNQESRNPLFFARRGFSSKSCTAIQNSVRKIETSEKDLFNANLSIIRLRST